MNVGFIGLGGMGHAIAVNIKEMGHEVTAWNRSPAPLAKLVDFGVMAANAPEDALKGDLLFTMLADDKAYHDLGLDGALLEKAAPGLVHVNMATVSVAFAKRMGEIYAARGLGYVASPVFGRPNAAAEKRLVIVAAGATDHVERAKPILEGLGRKLAVIGERPELANLFKISGNFLIASTIEALGESSALAKKGGIDPSVFIEVLTSTLFASPICQTYGPIIAEEKYEPPGFRLKLGYKDAGLTTEAAKGLGIDLPLAELVHGHFAEAMSAGLGEKDWAALASVAAGKVK